MDLRIDIRDVLGHLNWENFRIQSFELNKYCQEMFAVSSLSVLILFDFRGYDVRQATISDVDSIVLEFRSQDETISCIQWITSGLIAVGLSSGKIAIFDFSGECLGEEHIEETYVQSIRVTDNANQLYPKILWILYENGVVAAVPFSHLSNEFNFQSLIKYKLLGQEVVSDFLIVSHPNEDMVLYVGGLNSSLSLYSIGKQVEFQDIAKIAGYVKEKVGGIITKTLKSFWGSFSASPTKPTSSSSKSDPDEVLLTSKLDFIDSKRRVLRMSIHPNETLIGLVDNLGRVLLYDTRTSVVIRMWKGVRDARLSWCENKYSDVFDDSGLLRHISVKSFSLAIYAPQVGIINFYGMRHGPCFRSVPVGPQCQLFSFISTVERSQAFHCCFARVEEGALCFRTLDSLDGQVIDANSMDYLESEEASTNLLQEMSASSRFHHDEGIDALLRDIDRLSMTLTALHHSLASSSCVDSPKASRSPLNSNLISTPSKKNSDYLFDTSSVVLPTEKIFQALRATQKFEFRCTNFLQSHPPSDLLPMKQLLNGCRSLENHSFWMDLPLYFASELHSLSIATLNVGFSLEFHGLFYGLFMKNCRIHDQSSMFLHGLRTKKICEALGVLRTLVMSSWQVRRGESSLTSTLSILEGLKNSFSQNANESSDNREDARMESISWIIRGLHFCDLWWNGSITLSRENSNKVNSDTTRLLSLTPNQPSSATTDSHWSSASVDESPFKQNSLSPTEQTTSTQSEFNYSASNSSERSLDVVNSSPITQLTKKSVFLRRSRNESSPKLHHSSQPNSPTFLKKISSSDSSNPSTPLKVSSMITSLPKFRSFWQEREYLTLLVKSLTSSRFHHWIDSTEEAGTKEDFGTVYSSIANKRNYVGLESYLSLSNCRLDSLLEAARSSRSSNQSSDSNSLSDSFSSSGVLHLLTWPLLTDIFALQSLRRLFRSLGWGAVDECIMILPAVFERIEWMDAYDITIHILSHPISASPLLRWLRDVFLVILEDIEGLLGDSFSLDEKKAVEKDDISDIWMDLKQWSASTLINENQMENLLEAHSKHEDKNYKYRFSVLFNQIASSLSSEEEPLVFDKLFAVLLNPLLQRIRSSTKLEGSLSLVSLLMEVLVDVQNRLSKKTDGRSFLGSVLNQLDSFRRKLRLSMLISSRNRDSLESSVAFSIEALEKREEADLYSVLARDSLFFTLEVENCVDHEKRCSEISRKRRDSKREYNWSEFVEVAEAENQNLMSAVQSSVSGKGSTTSTSSNPLRKKKPLLVYFHEHNHPAVLGAYRVLELVSRWNSRKSHPKFLSLAAAHLKKVATPLRHSVAGYLIDNHLIPSLVQYFTLDENPAKFSNVSPDMNEFMHALAAPQSCIEFCNAFIEIFYCLESKSTHADSIGNEDLVDYFGLTSTLPSLLQDAKPKVSVWPPLVSTRLKDILFFYNAPSLSVRSVGDLEGHSAKYDRRFGISVEDIDVLISILIVIQLRVTCGLRHFPTSSLFSSDLLSILSTPNIFHLDSLVKNSKGAILPCHLPGNNGILQDSRLEFLSHCLRRLNPTDSSPVYRVSNIWQIPSNVLRLTHISSLIEKGTCDEEIDGIMTQISDRNGIFDRVVTGLRLRLGKTIAQIELIPRYSKAITSMDAEAMAWVRGAVGSPDSHSVQMIAKERIRPINFDLKSTRHLLISIRSMLLANISSQAQDDSMVDKQSKVDALLGICNVLEKI